ncbi:MAG: diguanylate cyclase [candidate division WOR-3 bacterium]|nr:MAG: diguanylate cyclase [candidate division WOR-3 bacterium]
MTRFVKIGYEGIEISLPLHALYLYRGNAQLLDNISPLINDGIERREKVIFIGSKQLCKTLRKNFRTRITAVAEEVRPKSLVSWLKREYRKLPKTRQGLRILLESGRDYVAIENVLDDFIRQPDNRFFVLCMYDVEGITSSELIETLKTHPYVFVEHLIQPNCFYSRVKQQNWIDILTGVYNRQYFDSHLNTELQRASRYEHNLSVIVIDIDSLRSVNEEFDMRRGDDVLKQMARILERSLRSVDILARYGGDEFIALLPETRKAYAYKTAQRILRNVSNHDFFKDNLRVEEISVSIGIAGFPEDAGDTRQMIKKVENALRRAKRQGGGRICGFE